MNKFAKHNGVVSRQSGFTLLEILVALLLGSAILTAAISLQVQHRKGFKLSSNKLEMQTNAKFAFEFISQYLRSAGSLGCRTSKALTDGATNPDGNCLGAVCTSISSAQIADANYWPGFEVQGYEYTGGGLTPALPAAFTFNGSTNDDSDVLTIAGGIGEVYDLDPAQPAITPGDTQFLLDMNEIAAVNLEERHYGVLSSCKGAQAFKVTSTDGEIAAGVIKLEGGGQANENDGTGIMQDIFGDLQFAEFRRAAVTTFFVGMDPLNDPNGVPVLYMSVDGESHRLIEGVEELHVQYGVSGSPNDRNIADRYVTADNVADWSSVVSVRVGLIMRSPEQVYQTAQAQNKTLDCVGYNQAAKNDRFSRTTYCSEIALRNRLIGARTGAKS